MVVGSRSMNVKKAMLWIHSVIISLCTCTALFITQIQILYVTVTSITRCDQYRVSTSLYRCKDNTHVCAVLHTHNWRRWYYRQIKSHYGVDTIVLRKSDVSISMYLTCTCTMYFHDPSKLWWERYNSNSACCQVSIIFKLFVMLWDHKCLTYYSK